MARVKEIARDIVDMRYKEIMKLIEANEQSSEIDKVHRTHNYTCITCICITSEGFLYSNIPNGISL